MRRIKMKKKVSFVVMFVVALALGMVLAGCGSKCSRDGDCVTSNTLGYQSRFDSCGASGCIVEQSKGGYSTQYCNCD
jgi:hypothetical protein